MTESLIFLMTVTMGMAPGKRPGARNYCLKSADILKMISVRFLAFSFFMMLRM
jgi:hypothetical protein